MQIDQVLNEYRQGDADKRMSSCLYYREFRDEFSGIEQDDPMDLETSRHYARRLLSSQPSIKRRDKVRDSTLSMKVFAGYLATLSFFLLFWPSLFLKLGFENISGPWVPTLGYIVGALAFFYFMAVREKTKNFYAWTAIARLPLLLFFIVLVALDMAPPVTLLIGFIDTGCAIWTALALKNERRALPFKRNALKQALQ
jgi:hypothetical protein